MVVVEIAELVDILNQEENRKFIEVFLDVVYVHTSRYKFL